jgi:TonB-linked SusC/RagA family outer membrane protein
MEKIKLFFTSLAVFAFSGLAFAQSGEVSGVVTDAGTGETVPYASIRVQGTMTGAQSDANGAYTVKVSDKSSAVLIFSFVGYKTKEVPVEGRSIVDVALEVDATVLEDVVVVAYGTQKKEAITGSVSSIDNKGLAEVPVASVDKMLAGKLAGVNVSMVSGQPGATSQIRIRGTGSINASNSPLWVVDGIPILSGDVGQFSNSNSALTSLNPNDIESITVLKDAAAAAAYGSRAANGVILVTTKRGREGQASFTASAKYGVNWLQSDSGFRMMSARELLSYQRDAIVNAGMDPDDPTSSLYRPLSLLNGKLYDPIKEFTRVGNLQEYQVGARGGNSRSSYYSSLSYQRTEGIAYGVSFEKFQGRINASYKLLKNLETGILMNMSYSRQEDVPMQSLYHANPLWAGETLMPWAPLKNEDGSWNVELPTNSYTNPRATAEYDEQFDKTFRNNTTLTLTWTPTRYLTFDTKDSAELVFEKGKRYWSPYSSGNGGQDPTLQTSRADIMQLTTSNTATYNNVFGGYHSLRVVLGQEAMRYKYTYDYIYAPNVNDNIRFPQTASQSDTQAEGGETNETLLSFFAIADYNYDNRYFLQANFREDGSSLFGENNKWGAFWSVSASWNLAKEKFMQNVDWLDLAKIRLSYGVNGNNGISAYQAYGTYASVEYNGVTGLRPTQLENKDLSWEKNKTWNVGVDFGFLNNRISGSIDVYNRKTVDLLLTKSIPQTTGFSSIFSNVGSMRNRGVEILLNADIISNSEMLWTVSGNVAFNRTKILDLGDDEFLGTWRRTVVGKSMYTFYLYDYYGVNPSNGEALYVAEDGSLTNQYSKARRHYCGSPEPKATGGFNTNFSWKGLDLGIYFEYKIGGKVMLLNENHYLQSDGAQMSMNQFKSATNYWKEPGDTGVNPKPVANNSSNSNAWELDRWLEDGSYLRLKDITLSYTLPKKWVSKIFLSNVKVYVSGLNLYCFNDVNFWDPEQGVTGSTAGQYPLTKSFVGGVEITF